MQPRAGDGRHVDEPTLVELAFHKFPEAGSLTRSAPSSPDTQRVREAITGAIDAQLVTPELGLTKRGRGPRGRVAAEMERPDRLVVSVRRRRAESRGPHRAVRRLQALQGRGTLATTKADELNRMLRVPQAADPTPLVTALLSRARSLRRVDKGEVLEYLLALAQRNNPEVLELAAPARARGNRPHLDRDR